MVSFAMVGCGMVVNFCKTKDEGKVRVAIRERRSQSLYQAGTFYHLFIKHELGNMRIKGKGKAIINTVSPWRRSLQESKQREKKDSG